MRLGQVLGIGLLAATTLAGNAWAGDGPANNRTPSTMSVAPIRTLADDKCVAQCDADSDKCMLTAGKDSSKQRDCDNTYTACLAKCG